MHRTTSRLAGPLAAIIVFMTASAQAQELRRDSVWNGVVAGAAVGASIGVVVAKIPADICSVPDCAFMFAVAGGALGHLTDRLIGDAAPVVPGQWIDDPKRDGALIGAGAGVALVLIDLRRSCGKGPGKVQCTAGGIWGNVWRAALFNAGVGAVVDAAIPRRAPRGSGSAASGTSRQVSVGLRVRF